MLQIGVGRIRYALGDGATVEQAKRIHGMLREAGLLDVASGAVRPCGVAEIAALAGVTSAAVCQWDDLPEPLVRLKQGRVWDLRVIEPYLAARAAR